MRTRLPAVARRELERAWLGVLGDRHPDLRWTLVRPDEGGQRDTVAAAGEIGGSFTAPEDQGPLLDRNGSAGATARAKDDGVDDR